MRPALTDVDHVTLCVSDLEKSIAFYRNVLGAKLRAQWATGCYFELGILWLCLEQSDSVTPRSDDSHIAFSTTGDLTDWDNHLRQNAQIWKENRSPDPSVYFLDPDGHKLELHSGTLASRLAHYSTRSDVTLYD